MLDSDSCAMQMMCAQCCTKTTEWVNYKHTAKLSNVPSRAENGTGRARNWVMGEEH